MIKVDLKTERTTQQWQTLLDTIKNRLDHYIQILGNKCPDIRRHNFHVFESFLKMLEAYDDYESSLESLKLLNC